MANDILLEKGGTGVKDFLAALLKPLQTNTDSLKIFEAEYTKRAKFNGQKIVLQAALNNIFGVVSAPFIIVEMNAGIGINTYFFESSELSPVYFYEVSENDPINFYESAELTVIEYDFKIKIPAGIHTVEIERRIKNEATLYKRLGTRFITEIY